MDIVQEDKLLLPLRHGDRDPCDGQTSHKPRETITETGGGGWGADCQICWRQGVLMQSATAVRSIRHHITGGVSIDHASRWQCDRVAVQLRTIARTPGNYQTCLTKKRQTITHTCLTRTQCNGGGLSLPTVITRARNIQRQYTLTQEGRVTGTVSATYTYHALTLFTKKPNGSAQKQNKIRAHTHTPNKNT